VLPQQQDARLAVAGERNRPVGLARRSVTFGSISELRTTPPGKLAIFAPGKVVAYAIKCPPLQALYLFRTTGTEGGATDLKGPPRP
jgi:hypothetical protein